MGVSGYQVEWLIKQRKLWKKLQTMSARNNQQADKVTLSHKQHQVTPVRFSSKMRRSQTKISFTTADDVLERLSTDRITAEEQERRASSFSGQAAEHTNHVPRARRLSKEGEQNLEALINNIMGDSK